MIKISNKISISPNEIKVSAVRSQGTGGQNVNKVATAIHLRFDIPASSLPDEIKEKLLLIRERRVSKDGVIIIKAQKFRTQEKNREDAILRLVDLIKKVLVKKKKRKPTKPTKVSKEKRLESKSKKSQIKKSRSKINDKDF